MKRGLVVIACGLVLLPAAAAGSVSRAPSPSAAKAAFGRALHQLYGDIRGYWTCLSPAVMGRVDCMGEVHGDGQWHQVGAAATRSLGVIWIGRVNAMTWSRRWSPYSRHYILRSRENAPGVVSVNSPAYDWGWLADCAEGTKSGHSLSCDDYDGNDRGLIRFYIFTCTRSGRVVTCKNSLGDAMRYRPQG